MKCFRKVVLMFTLTVSSLLVSTPCADAQWYAEAAAEAALLTQQIAQFLQDLGFDAEKWADVEKKLKEVRNIAKTISQDSQSYRNVTKAADHIMNTGRTIISYQQYLLEFGDNFKIDRSYYIYKSFMRRTTLVLEEVQATIRSFDRLRDTKPLQYLKSVNKATETVTVVIQDLGSEAKSETADLCFSAAQDDVVEQNRKFFSLSVM